MIRRMTTQKLAGVPAPLSVWRDPGWVLIVTAVAAGA